MSDDLEKRLREWADSDDLMQYESDDLDTAADELTRLRAEVQAHEAVRDACFEALPECQVWGDVPGCIAALKGECERLREAANAVVERWDTPLWKDAEPTGAVIGRLRAALKGGADK